MEPSDAIDADTVSVLLIFRNAESAAMISEILLGAPSRHFVVRTIFPEEAVSVIQDVTVLDVVVVDVSPPAEPGLEIVSVISKAKPLLPIVTWSDNGEDDLDDEALKRGAQDHMIGADTSSDGLIRGLLRAIQRTRLEDAKVATSSSSLHLAAVDLLDRLPIGVIMTDRDGHVRLVNRRAELLLAERDGLSVDRANIIRANTIEQTRVLHDLIRVCAYESKPDDDYNNDRNYGISINRPSGKPSLSVLTAPVGAQRPGSVLFVSDPEQPLTISSGVLSSLYGLTPAEARLVLGLVAGRQVEDLSEEVGTSVHTLRTQLKNIFRKTGTKRQTEVVKLVLTGPAALQKR